MRLRLLKACIACNHFSVEGYKEDKHCPYVEKYTGRAKDRTQFGTCEAHGKKVFCTEICSNFAHDSSIEVFEVTNRPEPLQSHQAKMFEVL